MSTLLLQTGDALLLQTGDRLLLSGHVPIAGASHAQAAAAAWLVRGRAISGQMDARSALAGVLVLVGEVEIVLDWELSDSADVHHYAIYRAKDGPVLLRTPHAVCDAPPWTDRVPDDQDGQYTYLVRAVDADGNEEGNIEQMVVVAVSGGELLTAFPAEPLLVEANPAPGGRIEVSWLYNPRHEQNGPGAAHEARIYWDAGTGTVDFGTPVATVALNHPKTAGWWSWQSGALEDGQTYKLVVRIATAAWPAGYETQNVDEHTATASASAPTAPTLAATVV